MQERIRVFTSALGLGSALGLYGVCLWGSSLFFVGSFSLFQVNVYAAIGLLGSLLAFLAGPAATFLDFNYQPYYTRATPWALLIGLALLITSFLIKNIFLLTLSGLFMGGSIAALLLFWIGVVTGFAPSARRLAFVTSLLVPALYNVSLSFVAYSSIPLLTCVALGLLALACYFIARRGIIKTGAQTTFHLRSNQEACSSGKNGKTTRGASAQSVYRRSLQELSGILVSASVLLLIVPAVNHVALGDTLAWQSKSIAISCAQLLSAILIFFMLKHFKKNSAMLLFFQAAVPVLIVALFLFPFMDDQYRIILLGVGSGLFFVVTILTMSDSINIALEYKADPLTLYGICGALTFFITYFGDQIMSRIVHSGISRDIQMIATAFFLIYLLGMSFILIQNRLKGRQRQDAEKKSANSSDIRESRGNDSLYEEVFYRFIQEDKNLSDRESEVLQLIMRGRNVPVISKELFISQNTVRTHVKRIYRTFKVNSRQELISHVESLYEDFKN